MRPPTPTLTVVRYLLLDRVTYLVLPWAWAAVSFVLDVVILRLIPAGHGDHRWVAGLIAVPLAMLGVGAQSASRALPFALALGVSRRSYFRAATTLALALATCFGLVIAIGRALEGATGGWGIAMDYFGVSHLLDGPWYLCWLTATLTLLLMFAYGMCYGLIHRRAGLPGITAFGAAQLGTLALAALVATWTHSWTDIGHHLGTATGLTSVLALACAVLLVSGFATIRKTSI
ncbi:ABC transporter permease [Streptomyces sp. CBMA152]|uniref:ABC transporter permease n=1 Tax=Streptomyces sp. CBMA152 TaxID=1896312 RepID=UPI0016607730|nr:ABC transporter permease [Streptomyces sp. CBMA152]MBD0742629.1 hypothetical protein [Streptomyces sp. CBMA152]